MQLIDALRHYRKTRQENPKNVFFLSYQNRYKAFRSVFYSENEVDHLWICSPSPPFSMWNLSGRNAWTPMEYLLLEDDWCVINISGIEVKEGDENTETV
jgi:hypothetical protein